MNDIKHYRFSKEFHEICKPIFAATPITFCSIGRLFRDGTYTGFMSDPDWTDLYLKKHYLSTLHFWLEGELNQCEAGLSVWSLSSIFTRNEHLQLLQTDCSAFNYHNGVSIIDVYPDYFELVRFSSPKQDGIESYFFEQQDNLMYLILYMKEKIEYNKVLADEFSAHYHLPVPLSQNILNITSNPTSIDLQVKKYYIGFPLKEREYLTKQEVRCLVPYLMGIQKHDIAQHYQISIRTVEKHIEHIKTKSICEEIPLLRTLLLSNKYISALTPKILKAFFS